MKSNYKIDIIRCHSFQDLQKSLAELMASWQDLLPTAKNAKILLKPNLNSNMNALTGNTTDLRLLAALIIFLKENGYSNITIGEGTNSGFYRNNISVISRLGVDRLAAYYGVRCIDLNESEPVEIPFENGVKAGVAKECVEADFFINMPKLKTHFEAGMSACLKNLIGCLVGQENKKKTHLSLAANIVNITENVRPHLHIIDAMFAMEGLGPTRGTPVRTDQVFVGNDPYCLDLLMAKYAQFDYTKVTTLALAEKKGLLTAKHHDFVAKVALKQHDAPFAPPKAGPIATFIHSPKRQKYFLAIRNTPFFNHLCNTDFFGNLLFLTGLRQDVFIDTEMDCQGLAVDKQQCSNCGKCNSYCPVGLELPAALEHQEMDACILCLYCFCVCPEKAIEFKGSLGFMNEQLKQYDEIIRGIA